VTRAAARVDYKVRVKLMPRATLELCEYCFGRRSVVSIGLYSAAEAVEGPVAFCRQCWRSWCVIAREELVGDGRAATPAAVLRLIWRRI
jgi:hypothetical protein